MFELLHNKFSPTRTETVDLPQKKLPDMLNPNDWAFLIYIFVVGLVVLIFHYNLPDWPWYIAAQASIVVITLMIIRFFHQSSINVLQMLRHWYPIFSFTFLYMQAGLLNQLVFQGYVDDFFLSIDLWIFGVNPNIWLYDRLNNFYFNEFIHLCYFSYYILPAAFGVILYITKDKEFYRTLFGISITFYFCYFLYILIPAAGPVDQRVGRFICSCDELDLLRSRKTRRGIPEFTRRHCIDHAHVCVPPAPQSVLGIFAVYHRPDLFNVLRVLSLRD